MYWNPNPINSREDLRAWVSDRVRFGQGSRKWLLTEDDGGWAMVRTDRDAFGRARGEDRQPVAPGLGAALAACWTLARNGGRNYLTPAGVLDLVDPASRAGAVSEGKRLAVLDEERRGREHRLEDRARETFEAAAGVPAAETGAGHDCRRADGTRAPGWYYGQPCGGCAAAGALREVADRRAQRWLREAAAELAGVSPLESARASEEGLAAALFLLCGVAAGEVVR